jgi:tRNA threonylcarbamoyladenosine modification (KEOPS) complex Cgi121 subunit
MISKSLWNEIMVYASLQRQVSRAIAMLGVKNYSGKVIEVTEDCTNAKSATIEVNESKLRFWNLTDPLEILERMAVFHTEYV